MSNSEGNQSQNDENRTSEPENKSDAELKIDERREYVYQNMCKSPEDEDTLECIADKFGVDKRTITRDKDWCREYRPAIWVSDLARHGFLHNTMEYETHMKNSLKWLYKQRDQTADPMEKLAFHKEISTTLNNIVAVGSKHPFYEGIKKIIANSKEAKEE